MSETRVISFRLDESSRAVLDQRAEELSQSAAEVARQLVLDGLELKGNTVGLEHQMRELQSDVRRVQGDIRALRQDLVISIRAILGTIGNVPPDVVSEWAAECFPDDHA